MRRSLLLISAFWLFLPFQVEAYDILIVKSQNSKVYDDTLRGLRSVRKFTERVISLSDFAEVDLKRIVKEDRPTLVVTLGDLALESVRKMNHVPVVSLMAISYRQSSGSQNVNGIEVFIPPERYLELFKQMKAHRVGVVYSKDKTGTYIQRAQKIASKSGVVLVAKEVSSPKEVFTQLNSLKGSVDILWVLPDSTVISQLTVEGFANFSIEQKVPLVSFASLYLTYGASAVIEVDRLDLGIQAGEMAIEIIKGQSPSGTSVPRKTVLKFNQSVLKRLGISTDLANQILQNWE